MDPTRVNFLLPVGTMPWRSEESLELGGPDRTAGRRWRARLRAAADLEAEATLYRQTRRNDKTRVRGYYTEWVHVNGEQRWSTTSLFGFVGSLYAAGLAASTVDTYVTLLAGVEFEEHSRASRVALDDLKKVTRLRRAEGTKHHAVDVPFSEASRCIAELSAERNGTGDALLYVLVAGPRVKDLTRLKCCQVKIDVEQRRVTHDLWVTKGIRRATARRRVVVPMELTAALSVETFERLARMWSGAKDSRPFAHISTAEINTALRDLGGGLTTNSFRRNYVHRVLRFCTEDGVCDFERASKFTGHLRSDTLQAFYVEDLSNI